MFCPECGYKNDDAALFCAECGEQLKFEEEVVTVTEDKEPEIALDETSDVKTNLYDLIDESSDINLTLEDKAETSEVNVKNKQLKIYIILISIIIIILGLIIYLIFALYFNKEHDYTQFSKSWETFSSQILQIAPLLSRR